MRGKRDKEDEGKEIKRMRKRDKEGKREKEDEGKKR